ncbi:LuxR family transcriptional regulator [Tersicoccus solisilvae]|uniref:LuxR family transcriptional regulator n=1 Tax=Tersicoccus solisilvae TaxID=1882339 RepID=A0ABQ1PDS6_9MICC|nr:alpha/beta fold hydrolase [Tersicoccus solisilvae]GGC95252.1 LuxR family transcriptional regulator [Tersicoccus solisilvae]
MRQHLGRVRTTDGTELAIAETGAGRPLVYVNGWVGHLGQDMAMPSVRAFYASLGEGARLVRYDRAGCGLSSPSGRAPSLAFELEQLDAVVGALGPGPVDLMGTSLGAPVAAAWAAAHPDAVRRLVLYGGWVNGADLAPPDVRAHILGLVEAHWGLGSEVLTGVFAPDAPPADRAEFGRYQRASSTAATARALLALGYELDVGALLGRVHAPALVVHRAGDRAAPVAQGTALARGIAGARLVVLSGRSHLPWVGDAAAVVAAVRRFLGLRVARRAAGLLTSRQREVAALVSAGHTNREIAAHLGIEERSAEGHVERIRLRLGVRSRAQVAAWYAAHETGSPPAP